MEKVLLNGKEYFKEKYLGKGKSGYSYLIKDSSGAEFVLKEIHYEPCPYYSFHGNKVEVEIKAYETLNKMGFKIPKLIEWNVEENYIIKEYIDGKTVAQLVAEDRLEEKSFADIFEICKKVYENRINLDYFPNNFVISKDELYYIDYEFNEYSDEWNFESWGIYYWLNSKGMKEYLKSGSHSLINRSADSGKPISEPFEDEVKRLKEIYLK